MEIKALTCHLIEETLTQGPELWYFAAHFLIQRSRKLGDKIFLGDTRLRLIPHTMRRYLCVCACVCAHARACACVCPCLRIPRKTQQRDKDIFEGKRTSSVRQPGCKLRREGAKPSSKHGKG